MPPGGDKESHGRCGDGPLSEPTRSQSECGPWLYRTVVRAVIDELRNNRRGLVSAVMTSFGLEIVGNDNTSDCYRLGTFHRHRRDNHGSNLGQVRVEALRKQSTGEVVPV